MKRWVANRSLSSDLLHPSLVPVNHLLSPPPPFTTFLSITTIPLDIFSRISSHTPSPPITSSYHLSPISLSPQVSLDFQALLEDLLSEKQPRNPTSTNDRYSEKPNGSSNVPASSHSLTHTLCITDTQVLFAAIDILNYSLSSSIFLDLKKERKIFADQLLSFQKACRSSGDPVLAEKLSDDAWFDKVTYLPSLPVITPSPSLTPSLV